MNRSDHEVVVIEQGLDVGFAGRHEVETIARADPLTDDPVGDQGYGRHVRHAGDIGVGRLTADAQVVEPIVAQVHSDRRHAIGGGAIRAGRMAVAALVAPVDAADIGIVRHLGNIEERALGGPIVTAAGVEKIG